jgi:hypothetical protein
MMATTYVPPVGRHLRTKDAAAFLGIAPQTLRNWKAQRIGPPARKLSGRLVVYSLDDLHAFMAAREATVAMHNAPACEAEALGGVE